METWKDIPGYSGRYQVSDHGRVRSLPRRAWLGNRWANLKGKILSDFPGGQYGHRKLALEGRQVYVHRLVLETFIGPCPDGMESCHFPDKSTTNNHLDNLRWGTHQENMIDREKHGSLNGKMARVFNAQRRAKQSEALKRSWAERKRNSACSPI